MLLALPAIAHVFEYDDISYYVLDEEAQTCETRNDRYADYSGILTIPSRVSDGNKIYTVIGIGRNSFCDKKMTSIDLPNTLQYIGPNSFRNCRKLKSVVIPESASSIGAHAFDECPQLESVYIPKYIDSLGISAFPRHTIITVDEENNHYCDQEGILFDKAKTILYSYPSIRSGSYDIPKTVKAIGDYAFSECDKLTTVSFPNSLNSIGIGAFSFSAIREAIVPNSVTSLGVVAFSHCTKLARVSLSDNIVTIEGSTFQECENLAEIKLPQSLATIGSYAFYGCCALQSISLPNTLTELEDRTFGGCCSITSIILPESLQRIRKEGFLGCSSLKYLFINSPELIIDDKAFADCNLTDVYNSAITPRKSEQNIFDSYTYNRATLHVREESLSTFKNTIPWGLFNNIVSHDFSGFSDIENDEDTIGEVYTANGIRVGNSTENLAPGIYIVRRSNDVQKLLIK